MRVKYQLEIVATVEKDGGYYGTNETLDWMVDRITSDARRFRVFLAEGALEPKQVAATVRLTRISVEEMS